MDDSENYKDILVQGAMAIAKRQKRGSSDLLGLNNDERAALHGQCDDMIGKRVLDTTQDITVDAIEIKALLDERDALAEKLEASEARVKELEALVLKRRKDLEQRLIGLGRPGKFRDGWEDEG